MGGEDRLLRHTMPPWCEAPCLPVRGCTLFDSHVLTHGTCSTVRPNLYTSNYCSAPNYNFYYSNLDKAPALRGLQAAAPW